MAFFSFKVVTNSFPWEKYLLKWVLIIFSPHAKLNLKLILIQSKCHIAMFLFLNYELHSRWVFSKMSIFLLVFPVSVVFTNSSFYSFSGINNVCWYLKVFDANLGSITKSVSKHKGNGSENLKETFMRKMIASPNTLSTGAAQNNNNK